MFLLNKYNSLRLITGRGTFSRGFNQSPASSRDDDGWNEDEGSGGFRGLS